MDTPKTKELRVRLRRVKPSPCSSSASTSYTGEQLKCDLPSTSKANATIITTLTNSSDSEGDDFGTAQMKKSKCKELSVRLRKVKSGRTNASCFTAVTAKMKCDLPSTSKITTKNNSSNSDDSDDFETVQFKLATALAVAANTPGFSLDWQSVKSALMSEIKSALSAEEKYTAPVTSTSTADVLNAEKEPNESTLDLPMQPKSESTDSQSSVCEKPDFQNMCSSSNSNTSSSDDADGDVPDVLLVSPEPPTEDLDVASSTLLSQLPPFSGTGVSVVDDINPTAALAKIFSLPPFDAHAPQLQVQLIIKSVASLALLSLRENNEIEVEIKKSSIVEFSKGVIGTNDRPLSPFMDFSNIHVKHGNEEFFTFCSCKKCVEYREIVIHIMVEQFKAAHMVVMLLDVLIKSYGPMFNKNGTAYTKFEKLLDTNKEIYWIACGFVYNKKAEHMDFIYDESLSDNMVLVLFSSILMVNNPLLLLQILAFHVECIVRAYAEGFLEIVEPDNNKIPAEDMLNYILDGYDNLCRISEQISCYLFAFENDFLRKFSLTWTLLCQRLYQQHVYSNLTDTMLACIITLKEDELTSRHAALIKKYIQFDDKMNYVEKRWTDVWIELNKFNLSEAERKRRKCLLDVYRIFYTVVEDAIAFSLQECGENDFYEFQCLEDRRLAWQNIMAYTKMKWPDGFFEPPNTLVCDDKCKKCDVMLEYHSENCKCITCSIAGGPLPPRRNSDNTCYKCLAHSLVEKEVNFYESKILNVCASDDFLSFVKSNGKRKSTTLEEFGEEITAPVTTPATATADASDGAYHLAWAVFHHFSNRKRYRHMTIEEKYFCVDCKQSACLLARKILNNEIAHALALQLMRYYQPLTMSREELRSILPNIMLYNRKMIAFHIGFDLTDVHDLVVKIYWTFIISLYATYFIEFDKDCPLNLSNLEIFNNDIRLCDESFIGNKDDIKFEQFLDKIKSLSPFTNDLEPDLVFNMEVHTEDIQNKLDKLLNIHEQHQNLTSNEKIPPLAATEATPAAQLDDPQKRTCKEKTKKCCFDHSDLGDHCKENHSSKKRIKKECNHARMNETRDRLRKKLSQLVNARKNMKMQGDQQNLNVTQLQNSHIKQQQQQQKQQAQQPPSLKSVASAAASAMNCPKSHGKVDEEDDSLECLSTLCKRISHLHTTKSSTGHSTATTTTTSAAAQSSNRKVNLSTLTPTKKQSSNYVTKDNSINSLNNNTNNNNAAAATVIQDKHIGTAAIQSSAAVATTPPPPDVAEATAAALSSSSMCKESVAGAHGLDMVSEIYEFLDSYSKDQTKMKKWINDTLSYIEGSGGNSNGKKQPQPTNPKKAAKKAKQKQRKEEEKRINELQDLRAQFHDIYFKEFTNKLKLKKVKASKKRDKKVISELEINIKKLQRAKAKVETVILELIATVKQTNSEFRFSYLPTKEQQLEKIKEIESPPGANNSTPPNVGIDSMTTQLSAVFAETNATTIVPGGKYNVAYGLPNPNLANFPYHIDFQAQSAAASADAGVSGTAAAYDMIRPSLPTPMCYAPPQHQQLSPDVVAAMAANAACSSNTDPSKRIVTIRRVNLPNVPEPQVTVTAKGSSPDKDKLLYTFVNGQLVQTGTGTPPPTPPMTQLPLLLPTQLPFSLPIQAHAANFAEHIITAIPPPPPLSKTQLKKERRRLAKIAAEEEAAAAEAERQRLEQELVEERKQLEKQQLSVEKSNKAKANDKKKKLNQKSEQVKLAIAAEVKQKKKKQKIPVTASASPTNYASSAVTDQRRSASATSSCSARTSLSATPISSQMNTRDNSVCSLKPAMAQYSKKGKPTLTGISKEKQKSQVSQKQQPQHNQQILQQQLQPQKKNKQPLQQSQPTAAKKTQATIPESTVQTQQQLVEEPKRGRMKRTKLIDNGQFDNNPFKSLNMQNSDSDWDSESSCDDGEEADIEYKELVTVPPVKIPSQPVVKGKMAPASLATTAGPIEHQIKETTRKLQGKRVQQEIANTDVDKKQQQKREATAKPLKSKSKPVTQLQQNTNDRNKDDDNNLQQDLPHQKPQPKARHSTKRQLQQQRDEIQKKSLNQNNQPHTLNKSDSRQQIQAASNNKRNGSGATRFERNSNAPSATAHHSTCVGGGDSGSVNDQHRNSTSACNSSRNKSSEQQLKNSTSSVVEGKSLSKRAQKQAQRNKKFQKHSTSSYDDISSGIPNNMGYFNPNEVIMTTVSHKQFQHQQHHQQQQQQHQYNNLTQQMQQLCIDNTHQLQQHIIASSYTNISNSYQISPGSNKQISANVSIMDQLNRGVQVENLSLPPGITLTKVDPVKSEQLRQKSESIKKLSKPLQAQHHMGPQSFHHPGTTVIATPVAASVPNYYGAPYAGVAAAALDQSGIIMIETNTPHIPTSTISQQTTKRNIAAAAAAATASASGKTSKNKKRRNKSTKQESAGGQRGASRGGNSKVHNNNRAGAASSGSGNAGNNQTKMITLRNPMFHSGAAGAAASIIQQQQQGLLPGGPPIGGIPMATPLSVDQPAAIIKNENGMFTIRNPALHQAVTNGLAFGGYRQFSNVNYYTPQEAAAEATRATQQNANAANNNETPIVISNNNTDGNTSSFSYFSSTSNGAPQIVPSSSSSPSAASGGSITSSNNTHNNISISCTSVGGSTGNGSVGGDGSLVGCGGGLVGDAAVIARPTPPQRCISAIGSEIKNAQQQKQKSKENQTWQSFNQELPLNTTDNLACSTNYLGGAVGSSGSAAGLAPSSSLQEKYQQSTYYNGFDVFPAKSSSSQISSTGGRSSNTGSLFDGNDCHHMHHNCGDDSPPPSITGYNSYLDGIPNTGVIRYDDASFLKNLIPGQNLNNEVSIHNVNDTNFSRSTTSPVAHRVEITPVYTNRPTSTNIYEHCSTSAGAPGQSDQQQQPQQQQNYIASSVTSYRENMADYGNDANVFATNNLMNLNELEAGGERDVESFNRFNYDFETPTDKQQAIIGLNDLLLKKSTHSSRKSPYRDESSMDNFVQNMNSLQISAPSEEQCSQQLNGSGSSGGSVAGGSANSGGGANNTSINMNSASATTNGWW